MPPEPSGPVTALIATHVRDVPDFPKPGVLFKDITPLLADADAFARVIGAVAEHARSLGGVELIAGVEARGFIVAAAVAATLRCGMVPIRKAGKLPPPTLGGCYDLEYGSARVEVPAGVLAGRRVLVVDDVLATGGTIAAAADLIVRADGILVGLCVLIELPALGGREHIAPRPVTALAAL
ncbi:MAG: adenine phosphoribosyltransferase [Mycobacteriales bacterium]|nr:MAG: adenine phosphoribosyltransferase [Pseudonocardiales bacterium]